MTNLGKLIYVGQTGIGVDRAINPYSEEAD